jgi:hypothetical protein
VRSLGLLALVAACGSASSGALDARPADAPAALDAPAAADAGGGLPGQVACGAGTCPATSTMSMDLDSESYCCAPASSGASAFCVHGNLGACESGNPFYCDEAADCDPGLVCCSSTVRSGLFSCATVCGEIQMCRSSAECRNAQSCGFRTCVGARYGFCGALTTPQAEALGCP